MWETRAVQLSVNLPSDIASQAEEVQRADPEFMSRLVLYGLTRLSIYEHLRNSDDADESVQAPEAHARQL